MGIRLAGGNKHGLFICEVQPNSVAQKAGLLVADKIFSVNNIDFMSLTREEAVICLMNMKTTQVNMIVANLRHGLFSLLIFYEKKKKIFFSRLRTIIIRCRR